MDFNISVQFSTKHSKNCWVLRFAADVRACAAQDSSRTGRTQLVQRTVFPGLNALCHNYEKIRPFCQGKRSEPGVFNSATTLPDSFLPQSVVMHLNRPFPCRNT